MSRVKMYKTKQVIFNNSIYRHLQKCLFKIEFLYYGYIC